MFKRAYFVGSIIWAVVVVLMGFSYYDPCQPHPGLGPNDYPLYCDGYTVGGAIIEGLILWGVCIPIYLILNWIIKGKKNK